MSSLTTETETTALTNERHEAMTDADPYLEQFGRMEKLTADRDPSWVMPIRKAGLARFSELGMPTLKDEDWRFTNVKPVREFPFRPAISPTSGTITPPADNFLFARRDTLQLVFVDGHFAAGFSADPIETPELTVMPLTQALITCPERVQKDFARAAGQDDNAFAALNNAFFTDGAFIHVSAKTTAERPVHLIHIATGNNPGTTFHPRHLIVAEAQSQLTVLESHFTMADAAYVNNVVTEMVVDEAAVVEHCKFQDENLAAFHLATIHAKLGRDCRFWSHSIVTGARIARNTIRTELLGEGLECVLNGLYLTRGEQLCDHHMVVNHAKPNCASHEYFNGILDDRSRSVFHGRILVQQEAQKTDAKQTNKNLLLSDDATADTKPQLEIYADDVRCTHGATVGQLDLDSIFYLRARGIGEDTAKRMLIHAFAGEIIERIQCPLIRNELDQLVWNRLEEHEAVAVDH